MYVCSMYRLLGILLLLPLAGWAQTTLTWDQLTDVKFDKVFSKDLGIEVTKAHFGASMLALDQQEVVIKGYLIPLDPLGTQYVLSKNPMASCFFCGGAGPESVIELRLHPNSIRRYKTDEVLSFKGKFLLNADDPNTLHYIITQAERQ